MNGLKRQTPVLLAAVVSLSFLFAGCKSKSTSTKAPANGNVEPDKILYDRALNDYQHGRYTEARLSLQTLINSYPDSEYLAKAKLAVADSYYKEGGIEGLTQAVAEYKDYITFFPFLDDAAYAQLQVGMAHYRMMEKPDRDSTQANLAEQEFQTFLLKYPKSPLADEAAQRLREVQEILASGDFDIAHFYYVKGDYRASASRLDEVVGRYPLFSQSDRALWMLGDIYRRAARGSKNEQERARWRTQSDVEYARLVRNYPLSPFTSDAKRQLTEDGYAVPPPDPQALAREQYEAKLAQDRPGIVHHALGILKSSPDVSAAAHSGQPDLSPPGEVNTPQDMLQGPTTNSAVVTASGAGESSSSGGQTTGTETVPPTESSSNPPTGTSPAVSVIDPPASGTAAPAPGSTATPSAVNTVMTKHPETETDLIATEELKGNNADTAKKPAAESKPASASSNSPSKSKAKKQKAPKADSHTESTSKKKKGIHKVLPW